MIPAVAKFLRQFRHLLGIDRAVGFTVMARGWSIGSGLVTILLIARYLSPAEQGYYYTFSSLVALQTVFELGFSFVVLQLAAHESAHLRISIDGEISGNETAHARLSSILQKSVRWYSVAAVLMATGLLTVGFRFFSAHQQPSQPISWKLPWICVALIATLTFQMDPVFSFLEGCGFVPHVARLRFTQAATGSLLAWGAFLLHHGLYAPAGLICGQAAAGLVFLFSKRHLLWPLLHHDSGGNTVSWRHEIWPFQWRIAVSWLCSYFMWPLFSPVLFAYRGAAEAGRMGMSISIAGALGTVAYAWVNTKASPFGNMIARRDYAALDRIFFRALTQSAILLLGAEAALMVLLLAARSYLPHVASRLLPLPLFAAILLTTFLMHVLFCEAAYLRAHKREPFLLQSILVACLTAASTLVAGRFWGAAGVTVGYFLWAGVLNLSCGTYIFIKNRRLWHANPAELASASSAS